MSAPVQGVDYFTLKQAAEHIQTEHAWAVTQLEFCQNWIDLGPYSKPIVDCLQLAVDCLQKATNAVEAGALHAGPWMTSYEQAMADYVLCKDAFSLMIAGVA